MTGRSLGHAQCCASCGRGVMSPISGYDTAERSPQTRERAMSAKRKLLLGMLALQNKFINRTQLLAAFNGWMEDKTKSLADLIVAQHALNADHPALLEHLTPGHLPQHPR